MSSKAPRTIASNPAAVEVDSAAAGLLSCEMAGLKGVRERQRGGVGRPFPAASVAISLRDLSARSRA
jgi:hypothetical protein